MMEKTSADRLNEIEAELKAVIAFSTGLAAVLNKSGALSPTGLAVLRGAAIDAGGGDLTAKAFRTIMAALEVQIDGPTQ